MKLDGAAYLLPPEPDRRVKLSRRAFLFFGLGSAAVGAAAGFSVGHAAGSRAGTRESNAAQPDEISDQLAWARQVATGPISDLESFAPGFLGLAREHPADEVLRAGVNRLAKHVLARGEPQRDGALALVIKNTIQDDWPGDLLRLREELIRFVRR